MRDKDINIFNLDGAYPCLTMNDKIGNLRNQSFKDIWNAERAKIVREKIKRLDCPKCLVDCETYSDIWTDFSHHSNLILERFIDDDLNFGLQIFKIG